MLSFMYSARPALLEVLFMNSDLFPGIEYNCSDPGVQLVSHKANILAMNPDLEEYDRG